MGAPGSWVVPIEVDLLKVFLLFASFLLIFHMWIFVNRPTSRTLKKIDYIWLSFGAVAIVGAVSSQRSLYAENVTLASQRLTQNAIDDFTRVVKVDRRYVCDTQFQYDRFTHSAQREIARATRETCDWLSSLEQKIIATEEDRFKLTELIERLELTPPKSRSPFLHLSLGNLTAGFQNAKKSIRQHRALVTKFARTGVEELLIFLAPYLLSFAIALRIAKVTGELNQKSD